VRSNVLVSCSCVFGFFVLVAGFSSAVGYFLMPFQQFLSHLVHVVAVDFGKMGRSSVLEGVDR